MRIIQFLLLVLISFELLLFLQESKVYSYTCSEGYVCGDVGGTIFNSYFYNGVACVFSAEYNYPCNGGDGMPWPDTCCCSYNYYRTREDCEAGINMYTAGCCNKISCVECIPGTAPSCPTGTTGTNTGDLWGTKETCCDNPSGCPDDENCNTRTCYCSLCTPPSCESVGLSSTALGFGNTDDKAVCRNGTSDTPDRDTKCDLRGRLCYCYQCELNSCPIPLSNTATTVDPEGNLILPDYRSCTNDCGRTRTGDCYEPFSSQPTEELIINGIENVYNFISFDHTGIPGTSAGDLNDPISMIAKYTDTDGAEDIEAVAVWLRRFDNTNEVPSPVYLSTIANAQAASTRNWGFMMHRENGTWVPYIPSWEVSPQVWVPATLMTTVIPGTTQFKIKGPNGTGMVIVTIEDIISSGDTVTMNFKMRFSGTGIKEYVSEEKYRIYLLGLDKFAYTPRNNYSDYPDVDVTPYWPARKLRYNLDVAHEVPAQTYARAWSDTLKSLTIDKKAPTLSMNITVSGNFMNLTWTAKDDNNLYSNLYSIVGNIYTDNPAYADTISFSTLTPGITFENNFIPKAIPTEGIGALNTGWAFKVAPDMDLTTHSANINIDLGGNRTGTLTFYITVYDDAGNMATSYESYDLSDWFVTDGGLAYSENGTAFQTREFITLPDWSNILPPFTIVAESLKPDIADYSSELWAEKTTGDVPIPLLKSSISDSYNIPNFKSLSISSYYDIFFNAYERHKENIVSKIDKDLLLGEITGGSMNGANACGGSNEEYCILKRVGDLNINPTKEIFRCSRNTLIFVTGNLTINPSIRNHQVQEMDDLGCIFVAKGNVYITEGGNQSSLTSVKYDQLYAYIFADGNIVIQEENKTGSEVRDGLYINGGLQALGSIKVERYLRFIDRSTYPVVVIDGHPKYGVISRDFLGGNILMQKTEVGFKP